jgi:hypothetical protein
MMNVPSLSDVNKSGDHIRNFWVWLRGFFKPYKEDKPRYDYIIQSIDAQSVYYFKSIDFSSMRADPFQGLRNAEYALSPVKGFASFLNKKLKLKEEALRKALIDFNEYVSLKSFPHRTNPTVFTIYWDTYDEWDHEQNVRATEIEREIISKSNNVILAFEDFRNFGNKLYAKRDN